MRVYMYACLRVYMYCGGISAYWDDPEKDFINISEVLIRFQSAEYLAFQTEILFP
jgi:hypothetical protein